MDIKEEAREKVRKWTMEGYDVSVLSDFVREGSEDDIEELLDDYTARILRLKRVAETLNREDIVLLSSMDTSIYNRVRSIRQMMRDPEKMMEVEEQMSKLLTEMSERQLGSKMRGLIDGISEEVAQDEGRGERIRS